MTDDQRELLMEARDSIAAAKLLLEGEYPGYAASRAYGARSAVNYEQAQEQIARAEQFIHLAERLIGPILA